MMVGVHRWKIRPATCPGKCTLWSRPPEVYMILGGGFPSYSYPHIKFNVSACLVFFIFKVYMNGAYLFYHIGNHFVIVSIVVFMKLFCGGTKLYFCYFIDSKVIVLSPFFHSRNIRCYALIFSFYAIYSYRANNFNLIRGPSSSALSQHVESVSAHSKPGCSGSG